jgi:hypothetical protein
MSTSGADPGVVATTVREMLNITTLAARPTGLLRCVVLLVVIVGALHAGPATLLGLE